jgi:peptidoglycan-associated lipoprotein
MDAIKEERPMRPVYRLAMAGFTVAALACHQTPDTANLPAPQPDTLALHKAHEDSLQAAEARARADAARRHADSLAMAERESARLAETVTDIIHFDFDRATIRAADAAVLDQKIPVLEANPAVRIEIAGNCDERGSDEYNLALGNRRAIAARTYLMDHGIDATRIVTISNGKEHPIDPGHDEEAWAQNRNDQFNLLTKNVVLRP